MEQTEKNLSNKSQNKKKNIIISLVIIFVIGLIGMGYIYYTKNKTQNIYYQTIDQLGEALYKIFDNENSKPLKGTGTIEFSGTTNSQELQEMFKILNKTKINMDLEMDQEAQKGNLLYDILYDEKTLLKANLLLNKNEMYCNLDNLYEKDIRLFKGLSDQNIWNDYSKDYKIIIQELKEILKDSLKKEYFSKESVSINIDNHKEKVIKHTLKLTSKDLEDIQKEMLNKIKDNDKLIEALSNISNKSKNSIISKLNEYKVEPTTKNNVVSEIYLDTKKELVKMVIKIDEDELIIEKIKNNEYIIKSNDNNIGTIVETEKETKIVLIDEETNTTINIEIGKNKEKNIFNIKIAISNVVLSFEINSSKDKVNGEINVIVPDYNFDFKINFNMNIKEVSKVEVRDVKNYIDIDEMTDEDFNKITENLINNSSAFNDLMKSI